MDDTSREAVERLNAECADAIMAMQDTFPTGRGILADCIRMQSALLDERDAAEGKFEQAKALYLEALDMAIKSLDRAIEAEARVAELEEANAALRAANDMLLRTITGDDNA